MTLQNIEAGMMCQLPLFSVPSMGITGGISASGRENGRAARFVSEDSLLERVTAAADERLLSQNTLTAYRRM